MISTHVLDTERGRPAAGVRVELYRGEELLAAKDTDSDGRIPDLAGEVEPGHLPARLSARSPRRSSSASKSRSSLADTAHVHVPLLLSPYGCTIYRGS